MWRKEKTRRIQRLLLEWYDRHKRDLPWRRRSDPYEIWVSEVMLQQTQVRTVLPYYERFLIRFPNIRALADAQEQEVIAMWAGLGYYGRARNLHLAAKVIVQRHEGKLPATIAELINLPGIGRYTAGAIASIAFNQAVPIVDGNVRRVIGRLHGMNKLVPEAFFWEQAKELLPEGKASEFNQAVMELGELLCVPSAPLCLICPVRSLCEARRRGIQREIPAPRAMPPAKAVRLVMLAVEREGRILLFRGRGPDFIPGEWGLPTCVLKDGDRPENAARELARNLAFAPVRLESRGQVRHGITFRRILIDVFRAETLISANQSRGVEGARWVSLASAGRLLTSSAFRKALNTALDVLVASSASPHSPTGHDAACGRNRIRQLSETSEVAATARRAVSTRHRLPRKTLPKKQAFIGKLHENGERRT